MSKPNLKVGDKIRATVDHMGDIIKGNIYEIVKLDHANDPYVINEAGNKTAYFWEMGGQPLWTLVSTATGKFKVGDRIQAKSSWDPGSIRTKGKIYTVVALAPNGDPIYVCDDGRERAAWTHEFEFVEFGAQLLTDREQSTSTSQGIHCTCSNPAYRPAGYAFGARVFTYTICDNCKKEKA